MIRERTTLPTSLPGKYKVRAEFKGFKAVERSEHHSGSRGEFALTSPCSPARVSQTITVTEDIPLINTTNAELGGTIQNAIINDLPLNGRNFENLLDLRPGVTIYAGGSGWTRAPTACAPTITSIWWKASTATIPGWPRA